MVENRAFEILFSGVTVGERRRMTEGIVPPGPSALDSDDGGSPAWRGVGHPPPASA